MRRTGRARSRAGLLAAATILIVALGIHVASLNDAPTDPPVADLLRALDRMSLAFSLEDRHGKAQGPYGHGKPTEPYFIDRLEVTNGEYAAFVEATGYRPEDDEAFLSHLRSADGELVVDPELLDHPVVFVSVADAGAYARWRGKSLMREGEWRYATSRRPQDDVHYSNILKIGLGRTTRVGTFDSGRTRGADEISPRLFDLLGNVSEWTDTRVPLDVALISPNDRSEITAELGELRGDSHLIVGGGFDTPSKVVLAGPEVELATARSRSIGFRCVRRGALDIIGALADRLADASASERQRVHQELSRFGRPLERVVQRLRFLDATAARVGPAGGSIGDLFVSPSPGRLVLLDAVGRVRLIDVDSGEVLDERDGFDEFLYAHAADLDRDGSDEVYFATGYDARVDEAVVVIDRDGVPRIADIETGEKETWTPAPAEIEQLRDAYFAADWHRRALAHASPGPRIEEPIIGFVPRYRQFIHRLDVVDDRLVLRWWIEHSVSSRALLLPDSGRLLVAGLRWFRTEGEQRRAITDLLLVNAAGERVAEALLPGGSNLLVPIDGESRFLWKPEVGPLMEVRPRDGCFEVTESRHPVAGEPLTDVTRGPRENEWTLLAHDTRRSSVIVLDAEGHPRARTSFQSAPPFVPRVRCDEEIGVLVQVDDFDLRCLDDGLRPRWELGDELIGLDLDSQWPVAVRFLPRRPQLLMIAPLYGFALHDGQTLEEIDQLRTESAPILRVFPVPSVTEPGRDVLVASFRDSALYLLRGEPTRRDRELRRLLSSLREHAR